MRFARVLFFDMLNECCPDDASDVNVAMHTYVHEWLHLAMRSDGMLGAAPALALCHPPPPTATATANRHRHRHRHRRPSAQHTRLHISSGAARR